MKLKLIAPLLLSLIAAPAFAHGSHDDDGPLVKPGKEVRKDTPSPKAPESDAAAKDAKSKQPAEAPPAPAAKTP